MPACTPLLCAPSVQAEQIICEFTHTSPEMYDKEPEKHPGVKHLGDMLVCMAESPSLAKVCSHAHAWVPGAIYAPGCLHVHSLAKVCAGAWARVRACACCPLCMWVYNGRSVCSCSHS